VRPRGPQILIYEKKLSVMKDMLPLLEQVPARQAVPDRRRGCGGEAWPRSCQQAARTLNCAAGEGARLRRPPQGHAVEDIAILTGGKAITEDLGIKLENIKLEDLARPRRCVVTRTNTTIVEGPARPGASRAASSSFGPRIEETTSDYDREKLQERLAKLAGGVAVIKVGPLPRRP